MPSMVVDERTVHEVMAETPPADGVGWFVARQPGLHRYLVSRLGEDSDAMGVALDAAWRIARAFEYQWGVPVPRLSLPAVIAAEGAILDASTGAEALRQPALCKWIATYLGTGIHLCAGESRDVALAMTAFVQAVVTAVPPAA